MPNNDVTQIPAMRVPFIDQRTGFISRQWYLFLFNLYNLGGGGTNPTSLTDLQLGPADSLLSTADAAMDKNIQALAVQPAAPSNELPFMDALQALAVQPPYTPHLAHTRYGSFSDTTTQTAAAINTPYAMKLNTTDLGFGVYTGTPNSRVYVDQNGIYNIQFSAQLDKTGGATAEDIFIWIDINGTAVANSATKITLQGTNSTQVAAWNFVFRLNKDDYIQIMWSTTSTNCRILAAAAAAPIPAIPSVIVTVTNNIGV